MKLRYMKKDNKNLLIPVKRAMQTYNMLEPGDRIAVGLSGGKDSSSLLYILTLLQNRLPFEFELVPICLTLGFRNTDTTPLEQYVKALGKELLIKPTNIGRIVFDIRQEKNPCSLCANLRRGALYNAAKAEGCNKAALGHHLDDAAETLFMNLLFNGKLRVFQPRSYLSRRDITVIRPMIYLEEKVIENMAEAKGIPIIENPCPANKRTKREEIKTLISELSHRYTDIRHRILHALENSDPGDLWS